MTDHLMHLSPDELDLWLDGRLSVSRMSHLETCDECHTAAEETREIITRLAHLPKPSLGPRFADAVMASVRVASPVSVHLTADDLDAWLEGTLAGQPRAHLIACVDCRRLADAEPRRQETDGASQGHQRLPDPRFDGDDRRVHRRDLREMELEHETKVRGDAAAERIDEFAPRRFQGR